jgi:hypothetical protein
MGNHAPVGFSFIDCFARRETDKRPSHFLFFLRRPLTEEDVFSLWVNQDHVNLDLCTKVNFASNIHPLGVQIMLPNGLGWLPEERIPGEFYRAGS